MPKDIIQNTDDFLQIIKNSFPKKIHKLLEFGFKGLSLNPIKSLNSNARSVFENKHTAESKIYRLVKNLKFVKLFPRLLLTLKLIEEGDVVAVDFSDFHGVQVLMFGKQTKQGRAIPLFFKTIVYPIKENSQNIFIKETIQDFLSVIQTKQVKLVFDRGFACPSLIKFLAKNKIIFYIRIKKDKRLKIDGNLKKAKEFKEGKYPVEGYDNELSLTVTAKPKNCKKEKSSEPWYIISNDLDTEKDKIQEIYYYRFEIEELFKDAKRLFGLEYIQFQKKHNFETTLWFVILGFWLQNYFEKKIKNAKTVIKRCKESFNQSITHYWIEQIKFKLQAPQLALISIKDD